MLFWDSSQFESFVRINPKLTVYDCSILDRMSRICVYANHKDLEEVLRNTNRKILQHCSSNELALLYSISSGLDFMYLHILNRDIGKVRDLLKSEETFSVLRQPFQNTNHTTISQLIFLEESFLYPPILEIHRWSPKQWFKSLKPVFEVLSRNRIDNYSDTEWADLEQFNRELLQLSLHQSNSANINWNEKYTINILHWNNEPH